MENNFAIGACGTFGSPNGFQQITYHYELKFAPTLDLNSNIMRLAPNVELFGVKKHLLSNGDYLICFVLYTYVEELQSSREGAFIGSFIVFKNSVADSNRIYACLQEFHNLITKNPQNILGNRLQVTHIEDIKIAEPDEAKNIERNIKTLDSIPSYIGKQQILLTSQNANKETYGSDISDFFTKAINASEDIGTLYFTVNQELFFYAKKNNLIEVNYLSKFYSSSRSRNYLVQQRETKPFELHNNNPTRNNGTEQIAESNSFLTNNGGNIFNVTIQGNKNLTVRLWEPSWCIGEINILTLIQEHNELVRTYLELIKPQSDINFNSSKVKKNLYNTIENNYMLLIILLLTLAITFFSIGLYEFSVPNPNKADSERLTTKINKTPDKDEHEPNEDEPNLHNQLNPLPNSKLTGTDLQTLNRQIINKMTSREITDLAIKLNPNDIAKPYQSQKDILAQSLIQQNHNCFDGEVFNKEKCPQIENVPVYKK